MGTFFVTRPFRSTVVFVLCSMLAGLSLAGCSPLGPTESPSNLPNADLSIETFSGTLPVDGSAFYAFSVVDGGLTYLSLASLRENGVESNVLVEIGVGALSGTRCIATDATSVTANGYLQLSSVTPRGVHCAVVNDVGNLTSTATFTLKIVRPK